MSDRRYTAILGAAVLTAGVATFSVYRLLRAAAQPHHEPTRAVVLVAQNVPAGVPIPREALSQVLWPERVAPPEAFASLDSVAGRVTRVGLTRGEPVRPEALAARGAAPGLEGAIAPDRRAIAVRVNEATGVSGLVRPDSRVDVLVTGRGEQAGAARLVMADVRVLGVGPTRPPEAKEGEASREPMAANVASIVTLEVTPAQAALAAAAEQQGTLQVVLRGFGSRPSASTDGASTELSANVPAPIGPAPGVFAVAPPPMPDAGMMRTRGSEPTAAAGRPPARRGEAAATSSPSRQPAAVVAAPAAPAPVGPDSVTVRVYRGGQMTVQRVEATAAAPARPPAGQAAPALRTAALETP